MISVEISFFFLFNILYYIFIIFFLSTIFLIVYFLSTISWFNRHKIIFCTIEIDNALTGGGTNDFFIQRGPPSMCLIVNGVVNFDCTHNTIESHPNRGHHHLGHNPNPMTPSKFLFDPYLLKFILIIRSFNKIFLDVFFTNKILLLAVNFQVQCKDFG